MPELENKTLEKKELSWEEIQKFKFNDLKEVKNRNVSKLKKSILERGFFSPFIVWKSYVIDGAGRYLAIKELEQEGYEIPSIPCQFVEANNLAEAKIYALQMSSKHGEITPESLYKFTVDIPGVENLIDEVSFYEFEQEFGSLEGLEEELSSKTDPDEGVSFDEEVFVSKNDIFQIKARGLTFRVGCFDSTKVDNLNKLFGGNKIDLVFTDPPYGVDITKRRGRGTAGSLGKLPEIENDEDTQAAQDFYDACNSLGIKNYILWGGNYFTHFLPPSRCWICWDKVIGEGMTFAQGELAWCSFDRNLRIFREYWSGNLHGKIDLETEGLESETLNRSSRVKRVHPTQRPVSLQKKIVDWAEEKEPISSIFDGFLGGGTMLLVGLQKNKDVFACELSEYYVQVSVKRLLKFLEKNSIAFSVELNGEDFDSNRILGYT